MHDYVILGGGISGLSYLHFLRQKGYNCVLLEKAAVPGGMLSTKNEKNRILECGPNTVINRNEGINQLLKDLKLSDKLIYPNPSSASERYILSNGKLFTLPTSPSQLIFSNFFSLKEKWQLISEIFKPPYSESSSPTVNEFMTYRFGSGIYNKVVVPFLNGIYAGNPKFQAMEHTLPEIYQLERNHGSVIKGFMKRKKSDKPYDKRFFTIKNGLSNLAEEIRIKHCDSVQLDTTAKEIRWENNHYRVKFDKQGTNGEVAGKNIISTVRPDLLNQMASGLFQLSEKHLPEFVPVISMHLIYPKRVIEHLPKGFGVLPLQGENKSFLGVLFTSNFFPHQLPDNEVLLTVIAGGAMNKEICKKEPNEIKELIQKEIALTFQMEEEALFCQLTQWNEGIPQCNLNHSNFLQEVMDVERKFRNFYIKGNFLNGPSVANCIHNAYLFSESTVKN